MTIERSQQLLRLRILVLALGEAPHARWWPSQFLSPTGLSYLSHLYPRSNFAAAVRSALRAAQPVHDASIGIGQVIHLMRLPPDEERRLDQALKLSAAELQAELGPRLSQRDKLLDELGKLADNPKAQSAAGALKLGASHSLRRDKWAPRFAEAYYAAFYDGVRVFPYIEVE